MESVLVRWQRSLHGGMKGACKHVRTPTLKSVRERNEIGCEKSESYLEVKLSHPYIGVCENNRFHEVWCLIRRSLGDTCTMSDAWGACLGAVT